MVYLSLCSDYVALLGEYDLHREDGYEQRQKATKSFRHPGFNDSLPNKDHRNDIMLIKLPKAATITRAVRPLALPSQCVSPGTNCLISGWGTISSPQCRATQRGWEGWKVMRMDEPPEMRATQEEFPGVSRGTW